MTSETLSSQKPNSVTNSVDSKSIAREIRIVQSVQTQRSMPVLLFGQILAIATALYIDWNAAIESNSIFGFAGVLLLLLPMVRSYWRLRGHPRPKKVSTRRIRIIEIYSLVIGITWGVSIFLLLPHLSAVDAGFVLVVSSFLWFGSVALNPSQPRTVIAYCAPFMIGTFSSSAINDVYPMGIAAFFLFNFSFGIAQSARQNWQDVTASILVNLEKLKEQAEHNRVLEEISGQLSKYMSPQLYQSIFRGEQKVEITAKRKKLTVFFSDIASFTEITDQMESEELTALLNHYLTEMSQIAISHGGTIDKFIGDAIVVYFGDPESSGAKEDADQCVRMAIAMQARIRELTEEWRDLGLERTFRLRIGINTGYCTVGNFGSDVRMDYTIIGSEVNLAARLESAADVGGILLANETYSLVKDWVTADEGVPITAKGFARPIQTYRVLGTKDEMIEGKDVLLREAEGISVKLDLSKLSEVKKAEVEQMLNETISILKQKYSI